MARFKYNSGDKIGPYQTLLLKRFKKNNRWYGKFKCSFCGENFNALITSIATGHQKSCGCITAYKENCRLGPKHIFFKKRTSVDRNGKWNGIFICPFCGSDFETNISSIVSGNTKSCGCNTDKWYKEGDCIGPDNILLLKREKIDGHVSKKGTFQCPFCKESFIANIESVQKGRVLSCGCQGNSKGEFLLSRLLDKLKISYIPQWYQYDDENKRRMFFDFYLPEHNCCIEYDGEQHYKYYQNNGWNTKENYLKIYQRDKAKNRYCIKNNIGLIRIPYFDYEKIDTDYLIKLIKCHKGGEVDDFTESNRQSC